VAPRATRAATRFRASNAPSIHFVLVRSLAELTAADLSEAGGKGANLGELRRAGFPVPDGFVITTAAYALAAEAAGVTGETPANARLRLAASPVPAGSTPGDVGDDDAHWAYIRLAGRDA